MNSASGMSAGIGSPSSKLRLGSITRSWAFHFFCLPGNPKPPKIGLEAQRGLVAFLSRLSQESHNDRRERRGDLFIKRSRLARNVAVDPLQGVASSKRQMAREHLVGGDSQRVEIAAGIHRAIHAAGLFGRHVGQGAGNDLRRRRRLALVRDLSRNAEAGEPNITVDIDEHIRRLNVLMYKTMAMNLAKRFRQANGNTQETRQMKRLPLLPLDNQIQWLIISTCQTQEESLSRFKKLLVDLTRDKTWFLLTLEFKLYSIRHPESRERWVQSYDMIRLAEREFLHEKLFGGLPKDRRQRLNTGVAAIAPVLSALTLEAFFEPKHLASDKLRALLFRIFDVLLDPT
jgi:hypothetical protein